MFILDTFLKAREKDRNPIRVGLWGAGEMAQGMVNQIMRYTPGMEVTVIANRTIAKAHDAYAYTGHTAKECHTLAELQACVAAGELAVTTNAELLCEVEGLDLLVECTGTIHYAANLIMQAIAHGRHVLMFNPEVDALVGPMLKVYADKAGVMLSGCEGDQPGCIMNLYRFVKGMGLTPLVCGNIKGLQDYYRNPTTQAGFAAQWHLTPEMVTSFADGTKISIEQTIVANATGMGVAKRGMLGYRHDGHVDDMVSWYDVDELKRLGGIVDYVVGPKPGPGVFVYATTDDPKSQHYLAYGKLGPGPLYSFYYPYHLIYAEIPNSIARMVLFQDVIMAPLGGPVVEVITLAKTPLTAGHKLDGLGGYDTYGQCENAETARQENLLPVGLAEGCILKRDVPRDAVLTFDDVELPADNLVQRLYREQTQLFFPELQAQAKAVLV
ncbi:NAD(P)-dependent oxidoreductase [Hymenobacter busanensis]|uniref:NAD(P)-dependent oxidoreductase n=1 Tax=Hymenobacter busanensis TaxID=2607656 RepID=A0A7L4ZVE2_9BACT|nr:NAD(P)-dependent oxidoreductase [Hymenobacter busanensis]KAA9339251.1 NAD(P)-dependent oxidoreductase [Hymenobacter busanensis]QHJ06987.1 NAD(P)-dependent oxidoreductase [Hymenobacter busanensis]